MYMWSIYQITVNLKNLAIKWPKLEKLVFINEFLPFAAGNGSFFLFPGGKFKTREMNSSTCGWLRSICRKWDIDEHDHWWCIFNSVWLESQNSKLESTKKTEFDCKCFKLFSNFFWIEPILNWKLLNFLNFFCFCESIEW